MISTEYINIYKECKEQLESGFPASINALRASAAKVLESEDLSSFATAYKVNYGLNIQRLTIKNDPYKLFSCDVPNIGAYLYYVVNDTFYANGQVASLPKGVVITSVSQAVKEYPSLIEKYYGRKMNLADTNQALNAMLAQDGLFVYVPENVELDHPIQLINLMFGNVDMMAVAHNLIILDKGAKAQVLVCDHSVGSVKYLANRVTEVFVEENAVYDHYKVENTADGMTNICSLLIDEKHGSEVVSNIITLHNAQTLNRINASLAEEHSSLSLCGLCFLDKDQYVSNESDIRHEKPNTTSFESFKYILDDESKGNFYGMIKVMPDAQKSSAIQNNRNICLSQKAQMKTMPQLEIYADDVKCNHGATVGQLDEASMFYMLQRGISPEEARTLLMTAFVHDVLERVRIESLKDRLRLLIEKRLRKEDSRCTGCATCKSIQK